MVVEVSRGSPQFFQEKTEYFDWNKTASFKIFFDSLFADHPIIRREIIRDTDSIIK
jgi:hypothetical protein